MNLPRTQEEWKDASEKFASKWTFPHALGAIDGKHVRIVKPEQSGSDYYNYKNFFGVVLFAVVDANYEIMYVHTGTNGRVADLTVFRQNKFYELMTKGKLNLPPPTTLPSSTKATPFVFLGDSSFAISTKIMKPYPHNLATYEQKVFNYRLSRARRVVENVFGILASRFRFYHTALNVSLDSVDAIVLASCVLHNFFVRNSGRYINQQSLIRGSIEEGYTVPGESSGNELTPLQGRNQPWGASAREVRETFKNYFLQERSVDFQQRMVEAHVG
ncbi:uncharacterized protein LOC126891042 [Diabrotica virgifera virgifera]|uniref:DDE Tnp4 domain-containing protein n=1 Tax=Diabrotica virgifera virgifera TaxID=50390 RepID=A0ABM5L164_DIAVI|nr:uncharacterized protein LOC126891042 [Diabrotica virgifera virgifera]